MLSDFVAFWYIFNVTTAHQTWLHCIDLKSLVKEFGQYLHWNPYKEREIVLDETIVEGAFKSQNPPLREKRLGFELKVAGKIREECVQAQAGNKNVLILLFGHGKLEHHGIHLSGGTAPNPELSKVFKFEDLQKNIAMNPRGSAVKVTVLTTHCYSGGWTCKSDANITTMTAAGDKNESTSWRASGSSGRYCGSMFASAIIEKMVRYGDQNKKLWQDLKEDPTEEQEETMATFGKSVYEILLIDVDRRGSEHCMTFGVQDDAWGMCWRERTGILLADYGERWSKLTGCDPDKTLHPGDVQNRDPRVIRSVRDDYVTRRDKTLKSNSSSSGKKAHKVHESKASVLEKRGGGRLSVFGGTPEGLISVVSSLGAEYLASYGPRDDTGADGGLQDSIRRIQRGDEKDLVEVESVLTTIEYRMNQMELADRYLKAMGIPAPRGLQCCMYNTSGLHDRMDSKKYKTLQSMIFAHEVLFPDPMGNQGQPFYYGHHYLIAAFDAAGISKDSVERKLEELAKMIDSELEDPKDEVKRDQEVVSKRRRVFQAFGFTPRDISPEERRSRG